jgi:predicted alpha/beta-fold hydrolase
MSYDSPMSFMSHFWTIVPHLSHRLLPITPPPFSSWRITVAEHDGHPIRLRGALSDDPKSDAVVVVVHGLGGGADSHYVVRAARAVHARGWACLRLWLRGADGHGDDLYHAGLATDIEAALGSAELKRFRWIFILGYSLGGHLALHAALSRSDQRLIAVAAVCAPLDLRLGAEAFDSPRRWLYRRHILSGLKSAYLQISRRRSVPTPWRLARRVTRIREWDSLTVVPRFGFADVDEYYDGMSVGPHLRDIRCPSLYVGSRHDPVVPSWSLGRHLSESGRHIDVWWIDKTGHVGFPAGIVHRHSTRLNVEEAILEWFARQTSI